MTFELMPGATPFLLAIVVLGVAAIVVGVLILGTFFVRHHARRVARHESIPRYYRGLALAH